MVIWDQSCWVTSLSACSVMYDSLRPHGLQPARLLCPRDFPGENTGMGCHFLLLGIFPTQGSNHICYVGRWISYHHALWEALTSLREIFNKCLLNQTNPNTLLMYHFVHLPLNSQGYNNLITLVSIFLTTVSILFRSRYSGFSKPEGIRISMVRESQNQEGS